MRICLVYDCLFPHTVGGAERWYRNLGERLAAEGHEVDYLTLRQWERGEEPRVDGVRVRAVAPGMALYGRGGSRRVLPPLVFGAAVLWHLLRHARHYDVVHTASFPYFSLLAAGLARRRGRYGLVVDWHEFWSAGYWQEYLGPVGGRIGWWVQALCLRVPQRAFCFARLTAARLREEGVRGPVTVLEGEYAGPAKNAEPAAAEPLVVFAGRHIPEKRAPLAVGAVMRARERIPELRGVVYGDGPERERVLAEISRLGAGTVVEAPGFVSSSELEQVLPRALCLLAPSRREGYGLVVVEAAAAGVPTVLVREPDNAATELIEEGVNGFVAESVADLPEAIVKAHAAGEALRRSTAAWFERNAQRLSIDSSLDVVAESYRMSTRTGGPARA
jgi:glycosyltransferase involved in cell wall biosynthesis